MNVAKKVLSALSPEAKKSEDGRDMFGNRIQFVLCAMGGAVGLGNLLRFPSVVYNNYGLQFFIPYLGALFFVAMPVLILEIALGTVYRGGPVLAWHSNNKRAKAIGLSVVFNGVSGFRVEITRITHTNLSTVRSRHVLCPASRMDYEVLQPLIPKPASMERTRPQRILL